MAGSISNPLFLCQDQFGPAGAKDTEFSDALRLCLMCGDEVEVSEMHRRNLLRCDAVLVFYGQASKTWVEMQMMDVVQAPGYGRSVPMRAQAVLVAGPADRRKERFRTHLGDVIRSDVEDPATAPGALEPFIEKIVKGNGGGHV